MEGGGEGSGVEDSSTRRGGGGVWRGAEEEGGGTKTIMLSREFLDVAREKWGVGDGGEGGGGFW